MKTQLQKYEIREMNSLITVSVGFLLKLYAFANVFALILPFNQWKLSEL